MKVIFLDIDGVLNADDDFGGRSKPNPTAGGAFCGISKAKARRLARIVAETGAIVVLTSSWKRYYERYLLDRKDDVGKYLREKLRKVGVSIFATTMRYYEGCCVRAGEVRNWLKDNSDDVESWVILDDECFDYDDVELGHLVKTDVRTGLTDALADAAIAELLREKPHDCEYSFAKFEKENDNYGD